MEVKPVVLTGNHVRLEPMTEEHVAGLAEIGVGQPFWDFMLYGNINTVDDMRNWVQDILARAEKGTDLPFVAIHMTSGRVAGATRYLNIMPQDRGLEIGIFEDDVGVASSEFEHSLEQVFACDPCDGSSGFSASGEGDSGKRRMSEKRIEAVRSRHEGLEGGIRKLSAAEELSDCQSTAGDV